MGEEHDGQGASDDAMNPNSRLPRPFISKVVEAKTRKKEHEHRHFEDEATRPIGFELPSMANMTAQQESKYDTKTWIEAAVNHPTCRKPNRRIEFLKTGRAPPKSNTRDEACQQQRDNQRFDRAWQTGGTRISRVGHVLGNLFVAMAAPLQLLA